MITVFGGQHSLLISSIYSYVQSPITSPRLRPDVALSAFYQHPQSVSFAKRNRRHLNKTAMEAVNVSQQIKYDAVIWYHQDSGPRYSLFPLLVSLRTATQGCHGLICITSHLPAGHTACLVGSADTRMSVQRSLAEIKPQNAPVSSMHESQNVLVTK
jgi:hypothetical protein